MRGGEDEVGSRKEVCCFVIRSMFPQIRCIRIRDKVE